MTYKDAYNHLMQVRFINKRIWLATVERDELQSCLLPSAIRYDKDPVQTSPSDKMGEIAAAVLQMDRRIRELQVEKARTFIGTRQEIDLLDDEDQREILKAFFLARQPMARIAEKQNRSLSGVYEIRRQGSRKLCDLL